MFGSIIFMYWLGINSHIYRALIQLKPEGLVTTETQHKEHGLYNYRKGCNALCEWVVSPSSPSQLINTFLIQVTWANLHKPDELKLVRNMRKDVKEL